MIKIIKDIKKNISLNTDRLNLRKKIKIFIPYEEIYIECRVKNSSELNLFFEVVLELIENDVCVIGEIKEILGISIDLMNEIIIDMYRNEFIVIVAGEKLELTDKGINALRKKEVIEYEIKILNIYINLITGEIVNRENIVEENISKYDIYLAEEIRVDKEFLEMRLLEINDIYEKDQRDNKDKNTLEEIKEIDKIIDIKNRKILYEIKDLNIYSKDTYNDLEIKLKDDKNDKLINSFLKQIKLEVHPTLDKFFELDREFIRLNSEKEYADDKVLLENTEKLKNFLKGVPNIINSDIDKFCVNRYLITNDEYIKYFQYYKDFEFDEILIETNRVGSFLTPNILENIKKISRIKKITIIYDEDEFNSKNMIERFLGKEVKNITLIHSKDIKKTKIKFLPSIEMDMEEIIVKIFGGYISYKIGKIKYY